MTRGRTCKLISAAMAVFAVVITASAQQDKIGADKPKKQSAIPIYITPYYDSDGTKIDVGTFSKKLANADATSILGLAAEMKKQREKLRAEAMYVLAIRLYDLGHKDEAVYWFYAAQYRARLFVSILDKGKVGGIGEPAFELKHAYNAFHQLSGPYINGYAFGELDKLDKTIKAVVDEGKTAPQFSKLYPEVRFSPPDSWPERNKEIAAGLGKLREYIRANADEIKAQRKKNGIEGKY